MFDNLVFLFLHLIKNSFRLFYYKGPVRLNARPISFAAECIKFVEGIKNMAQGYKL